MSRHKRPPHVVGYVKPGFELVKEVFRSNLDEGLDKGGNFAAYYKGELVVNIWGGYSDVKARRLWNKDTYSCFYSTTKSPCAVVIAHLVDRGLIKYSDKVSKYWPEFAAEGKGEVTLEQLVSNQGGVAAIDEPFTLSLLRDDPEKLSRILANQKPLWKPGTNHGYHPITFALYLDQVVRHVDPKHRSLSQYFHDEISIPFGIEFYIGLPKPLHYKSARITMMKDFDQEDYLQNFKGDINILQKTGNNPSDFRTVRRMNDPDIKELPVGSICGFGTAESMAKFHGILACGGTNNGQRLLSEENIKKFEKIMVGGFDLTFSMDCMWSLGPMVFPVVEGNKPPTYLFGHGGYGGQMALADTKYKVGLAYTTSHLDPTSRAVADADVRWPSLYDALYKCIHKIENVTDKRKTFYLYTDFKDYLTTSKL